MSPIKNLIGRRQFLIAAGVTSTCALTCKKLAGFLGQGGQIGMAMADEKAVSAAAKTAAKNYPHLLSPLRIRNKVLKNRIMHTQSSPHLMQGPETFPTDLYRSHYSNMAKNAAIVSMDLCFGNYPKTYDPKNPVGVEHNSDHLWEDIPPVHNYVQRMIEDIHCEGSLVYYVGARGANTLGGSSGGAFPSPGAGGMGGFPGGGMPGGQGVAPGAGGQGGVTGGMPGGQGGAPGAGGQGGMPGGMPGGGLGVGGFISTDTQGKKTMDEIIAEAKKIEDYGYDVVLMDQDKIKEIQAVRNATNLLVMVRLAGQRGIGMGMMGMPGMGQGGEHKKDETIPGVKNLNVPSASDIETVVEAAKKLDGIADIIQLRDYNSANEHPTGFDQGPNDPYNLAFSKAVKKAGVKAILCPTAGFHDPDLNEGYISSGYADIVGITTPFFADPEYVKKLYEGRADDIIPCVMCHNCHGISDTDGPWYDTCTVNPTWALPFYKRVFPAPAISKKVAIMGGGPAGMKAAITAAERGHKVTIYEKDNALGGLLRHTDYSEWRLSYKKFKDYLINQVKKAGIEVRLNTAATPETIKAKGYDTVIVALGAEPVTSRMPGADAGNVFNILTAYSNKKALGQNVVMIGSGKFGTEAAIGMAKDGHKITVLTSGKRLVELKDVGPHNMRSQMEIYENHPNFNYVLEAAVKSITGGKVIYTDSKGNEKSIQADSIVIHAGLKPRMDEAMKFTGSANQVLFIGDCTGENGTIQKSIRSAYFMASQV